MGTAKISIEKLIIPTYPEPEREAMPIFSEHRVHQRSSGRPYPNKVTLEVNRAVREDREYEAVHLENDYLDVWVLPQIGGRIFAAQDKSTGYDFFYRQHVIKPALIGAMGSWISGGVEFNWPYHHRPSGFMPCDYQLAQEEDGSVICWLSEHDPVDRMKGMVGIVLRTDAAYLETRVQLCNRTPIQRSFLWWENAAVPVGENYQIFFPHDVTYVNFHYLDSRISYPIAGGGSFNGIDMHTARDISWHKNTRDATSYFACASKYDFFGGYDHGKNCGVVHVADHHTAPGKKMFTWAYNQLSKSWENALTDSDGQYAELMAGSYTDNQPNFSWLEPYETKAFSQFWYPIQRIGIPDFANLDCAMKLETDKIALQATRPLGRCRLLVTAHKKPVLDTEVILEPQQPQILPWIRPDSYVTVTLIQAQGETVLYYQEEEPDDLKMPPVKDPMPLATEVADADTLYRAGVHVEQYRDPAVMPDAYWLEALKRNPDHAPSLLGMARYCYQMLRLEEGLTYASRAVKVLTRFNANTENGEGYYLCGLLLEALGRREEAYDMYYKASWNGSAVAKAMGKLACIDLGRGDWAKAEEHARRALGRDELHPMAAAVRVLALQKLGRKEEAKAQCREFLRKDPLSLLARWLNWDEKVFFASLKSSPGQSVLDLAEDLNAMGQTDQAASVLEHLCICLPGEATAPVLFTLAYLRNALFQNSREILAAAETAPDGLSFPSRLLEARALEFAGGQGSVRAVFLQGCLLYDRRHYADAAQRFEEVVAREPTHYMARRNLAIAFYSHLNRQREALPMMEQALAQHPCSQLLYETVVLMDKMACQAQEKIDLLESHRALVHRDDLNTELAKAYNQAGQPEKALEILTGHTFIPCEGGEHAIADQYMFAWYQLGGAKAEKGDWKAALADFEQALTLPSNLGAGIWNRCKYVPYHYRMAQCMERLDRKSEAERIYRDILDIEVEFFSNMHLPELPIYQALAAKALGLEPVANRLAGFAKQKWTAALEKGDNGFFATTPFFISFVEDPAQLHRAYYLYLLGWVEQFCGHQEQAGAYFREAAPLNTDNMFCGYFAANT